MLVPEAKIYVFTFFSHLYRVKKQIHKYLTVKTKGKIPRKQKKKLKWRIYFKYGLILECILWKRTNKNHTNHSNILPQNITD